MDAATLYAEAWASHQRGDHGQALEMVLRALALDPDVENGHNLAGWILFQHSPEIVERLPRAIAHFEEAHARRPDLREPLVNLCDALVPAGRVDEAVAICERTIAAAAVEHDRSLAEAGAQYWLGWHRARREGNVAAALPHFARAAALRPRWGRALHQYAIALEVTGALAASYDAHRESLFCDDLPDRALAHARLGWHEQARGLPSASLSSFRRALFHERRGAGARAPEIEQAARAREDELRAKGTYFPHASDELEWIAIEWRENVEGMRHLMREKNPPTNLRYLRVLARRAQAAIPLGDEDVRVRLADLARVAALRDLPVELAGVRLSPLEWSGQSFASEAIEKLAARWPATHAALYQRVLERELVPGSGECDRMIALAAVNDHEGALAVLEEVRGRDLDAFITCAGNAERLAEDAHFVGAGSRYRRAYLERALEGAEIYASWSTSGGEGLSRMVEVERLRKKLRG